MTNTQEKLLEFELAGLGRVHLCQPNAGDGGVYVEFFGDEFLGPLALAGGENGRFGDWRGLEQFGEGEAHERFREKKAPDSAICLPLPPPPIVSLPAGSRIDVLRPAQDPLLTKVNVASLGSLRGKEPFCPRIEEQGPVHEAVTALVRQRSADPALRGNVTVVNGCGDEYGFD